MFTLLALAAIAATAAPPEQPGPSIAPAPQQRIFLAPPVVNQDSSSEAARARANLASYISGDDYPEDAYYDNIQGTVGFRLDVSSEGGVTGCSVTASSGSQSLDETTCRIMIERARFAPARDARGLPTVDSVSGRVRWQIEDDGLDLDGNPPPPGWRSFQALISAPDYPPDARAQRMEGTVEFALGISTTGTVTACRILGSSGSLSLDRQTCSLMRQRVHLPPQRDASGRAVATTINGRVGWQLPYADILRVQTAPPPIQRSN